MYFHVNASPKPLEVAASNFVGELANISCDLIAKVKNKECIFF